MCWEPHNWEQGLKVSVLAQGVRRMSQDGGQEHHRKVQDRSGLQSSPALSSCEWDPSGSTTSPFYHSCVSFFFWECRSTEHLKSLLCHCPISIRSFFQRVFLRTARKLKSPGNLQGRQEGALYLHELTMWWDRGDTNSSGTGIEHLFIFTCILITS